MKKTRLLVTFLLLGVIIFTANTHATIIVSGDASMLGPLDPKFKFYNPGNQQFFSKILNGATSVAIVDQYGINSYATQINYYYSSSGSIKTSLISTITSSSLDSIGMLFVPMPLVAFSDDEMAVMDGYIDKGGSVFFLGDGAAYSDNNAIVNQALQGIGSSLSIENDTLDPGRNVAKGKQIAHGPFTIGVQSLTYAYVSEVNGGTALFSTTKGISFVAYENSNSVPEPSMAWLMAASFLGLCGLFKKKKRN